MTISFQRCRCQPTDPAGCSHHRHVHGFLPFLAPANVACTFDILEFECVGYLAQRARVMDMT
jgi:hypothetical protein